MYLTRRSRAVVALAGFMAAYGVVLGRSIALAGAVLIGAWFVGRQSAFVATLSRIDAALSIEQVPERTSIRTGETEPVHVEASVDGESIPDGYALSIGAGLPTAATATDPLTVALGPNRSRTSASTAVEWPIAGRHRFEPATVDVANRWFGETLPAGDRPTVTVEPRGPRSIHVGEGGERFAVGTGEHGSGWRGSGLEPAEVREYTAGDTVRRIDWKATARLDAPHVREFESATDRATAVVVDARRSLAIGPDEETPLSYLTDVALAIVASARRHGDPIGLVTVGDEGIRTQIPINAATETGVRVRRELLDLEPVEARASNATQVAAAPVAGRAPATEGTTTAADAQAARSTLQGDDAFARTLSPFYADRRAYVERVESEPLFAAVDELLTREAASPWTVVLTDDAARAELRETVANARSRGSEVLVAIAPHVLYESGGLADVERAYERYVDFEEFRRTLSRQPGVTALEVGPADRLATVLEAGRHGGRPANGGDRR